MGKIRSWIKLKKVTWVHRPESATQIIGDDARQVEGWFVCAKVAESNDDVWNSWDVWYLWTSSYDIFTIL